MIIKKHLLILKKLLELFDKIENQRFQHNNKKNENNKKFVICDTSSCMNYYSSVKTQSEMNSQINMWRTENSEEYIKNSD